MITFIVSTIFISIALYVVFRLFSPTQDKIAPPIIMGIMFGVAISLSAGALVHKDIESKNLSIYEISEKIVLIKDAKNDSYFFNNSSSKIFLKRVAISETTIIFSETKIRVLEIKKETHDEKWDKWFFIQDHEIKKEIFLLESDREKIVEVKIE